MAGQIDIKFDGACHNKVNQNNVMGIGVAVFFDDEYIEEESLAIRIVSEYVRGTSNVAEWEACIEAWRKAKELSERYPGNQIRIYSDSQVVTNQFNGDFAINEPAFHSYFRMGTEIRDKMERGCKKKIIWIKRDFNKEADKLSKDGLKIGLITRAELGHQSILTNISAN